MNLDSFYGAFSSATQAINNIGQSLVTLSEFFTGTPTVTTTVSSLPVVSVKAAQVYPGAATALTSSSGSVANATASASLGAFSGKTTYLVGFRFDATGATSAAVVSITLTGLLGGTMTFTLAVPAGATTAAAPLIFEPPYPIPASGTSTPIGVSCPALGAGNTNATINIYGFSL